VPRRSPDWAADGPSGLGAAYLITGRGLKPVAGALGWQHDVWVTWTAPEIVRADPPTVAGERRSLESWLDYHRATLLYKCQGLAGDQLAQRAVGPSSLSLLGLVRHMAEVERAWFRRRLAGQPEQHGLAQLDAQPDQQPVLADQEPVAP